MTFIPISDETYRELVAIKEPEERLEDVIVRLIKKSRHIEEFFKEQFREYMEHDVEEDEG